MLIRVVLFLGVGLVLAAFGAAGWQYYQSLPERAAAVEVEVVEQAPDEPTAEAAETAEAAPDEDVAEPGQVWLISQTGGLVPRRDARAFLQQAKFVKERSVTLNVRLPLTSLLSQNESLPDEVYREAFAEVRAGVAGSKLCAPMLAAWAADCVIADVGLVKNSYDAASGTAEFRVIALFTLKPEVEPLPDLGTRAFAEGTQSWRDLPAIKLRETPEGFLDNVVNSIPSTCKTLPEDWSACRVMAIKARWESPSESGFDIKIGALEPLPKGLFPAPPLF